ncbi:MAG: hypothetical protein E7Z89_02105 [Cyanobacteria bacterium SIG28]|nr:hypothetical protein [Cyanobacteria bacterium SIG28]
MKKVYFFYALILIGLLYYLFYLFGQIKIVAEFEELEPFRHSVPVYYKGFKLGHSAKIHPGKDYTTTLVDLKIRMKDLQLPANTTAIVRRKDKKDYIELVYPNAPYIADLKHNTLIQGTKGSNFEHFIEEQANNGGLDEIKDNINGTIKSAGETFNALTEMINVLTGILEDVRPRISDTVENINLASENLAESSYNIRTSIQQGYIDSSLNNLEKTTKNLVITTQNMSGISDNINNNSVNLLNCFMQNINIVVKNINEIVIGLGNTLKKRFGGIRLFFGKTIS